MLFVWRLQCEPAGRADCTVLQLANSGAKGTGPRRARPGRNRIGPGIEALAAPARVNRHQKIPLTLNITNAGNAVWYRNSSLSHQVRIGVWMTGTDGNNLGREPARYYLPKDVKPGESVTVPLDIPAVHKPGQVEIHIDPAKEFCFWFREKGSPEKIIPLEIE